MKKILMKNVGSGQHILLWPDDEDSIVVDFGVNSDKPQTYHNLPLPWVYKKLIISHFHDDHYNGFYKLSSKATAPSFFFNRVYYPKMPQIAGSNAVSPFLVNVYIYAITIGISLSFQQTHYQNLYDFFKALINYNSQTIVFTPVNKGNIITSTNHSIEILWPEKTTNILNRKPFEEIYHLFKEASKLYPHLSSIEQFVRTVLLNLTDSFQGEFELSSGFLNVNRNVLSQISNTHLSKNGICSIRKLNKKLKDILNKWSIAFITNDDILFLGDLYAKQINKICKNFMLQSNKLDILVAAHHGTHIGFMLKKLLVHTSIASIGAKLYKSKQRRIAFATYNHVSSVFIDTIHHKKDIVV